MKEKSSRREFVKKSAFGAAALTLGASGFPASSYKRIIGANERLTVALVGAGRRFPGYLEAMAKNKDNVHVAYIADVMKSRREKGVSRFNEKVGYTPVLLNDFRRALEDRKVDAMFFAIPDHWHAPATWMALEAGKNVYVEKPLTHNPRENEVLLAYLKKYKKIVQMGNQQRSAPESIEAIKMIHEGAIGKPYLALAFYTNARGRVKNPVPAPPPAGLDWDLFQGPAPREQYVDNVFDYNWHWYGWRFGTAETGNNATHELDIARWALQVDYPQKVIVNAGKYHFVDDGWTMYDTMDATFTFAGDRTIKWDGKSRNGYSTYGSGRGTIVYGSEGTFYIDRGGYRMYDRSGKLMKDSKSSLGEAGTALGGGGGMTTLHIENFFEAIRGKAKLDSPIDEGGKSTLLCHLANIASRTQKELKINPSNGHILDKDAMKLWGRAYEPGWEPKGEFI
ncbi:MAG TPA: Gfo/Idh/MocA family oxidoreductase [Bacteroidetes bacterium]|nr:Gfo/Idh/MocA family oxidoreductase [Bacteroidota bacterium]